MRIADKTSLILRSDRWHVECSVDVKGTGMDMLAIAVAVPVGAEQTGVPSALSGRTDPGNESFAQSLDALVAQAANGGAVSSGAVELAGSQNRNSFSEGDVQVAAPTLLKGSDDGGQVATPTLGDGKKLSKLFAIRNLNMRKDVSGGLRSGTAVRTGSIEPKNIVSDSAAVNTDASMNVPNDTGGKAIADGTNAVQDGVAAGEATGLPVQSDLSLAMSGAVPASNASADTSDQLSGLHGTEAAFKKMAGDVEREPEVPAKKTSKKQESDAKTAMPSKGKSPAETATIDVAQSIAVPVEVQSSGHCPYPVLMANVEEGQQGNPVNAVTAQKVGAMAQNATAGVQDGKGVIQAGKQPKDGVESATQAKTDMADASKFEAESGKIPAAGQVAEDDAEKKMQSAVGTIAPAHVAVGTAGAATGPATGIAAVHIATDAAPKAQAGIVIAQAFTAHTGAAEQNGHGAELLPSADGMHRTLEATPTSLEVGLANGTQGWLKIRAEMAGGGVVNASLSSASPSGQEMLHRELPSLTAFLQQERIAVNTVVIHPAAASAQSSGLTGGMSGGDTGAQAQQRNGQGEDGRRGVGGAVVDTVAQEVKYTDGVDALLPTAQYAGGGWLSVRA